MLIRSLFLAGLVYLLALTAWAHGPARGPNGGQMQDVAGAHVELVAHGGEIAVYLFNAENKPMPAQGAAATVTVLAHGKQETVTLQPGEGNVLRGRGSITAQPGMKVVVSLTLPGQRPQLGRYAPLD